MSQDTEITPVMTRRWAQEYAEHVSYYYKVYPPGTCGVRGCGRQIAHRYIMRSVVSGDVVEIGWACFGHWCDYHGAPTSVEFEHYKAQKGVARRVRPRLRPKIEQWGRDNPGKKLPAHEIQRMAVEAEEEQRIEGVKRKGVYRKDIPVREFLNLGAVQAWAKAKGGFAPASGNPFTRRDKTFWLVYLPK